MKTIIITITITINIITIVITLNIITVNLFNIIVVMVILEVRFYPGELMCYVWGRDGPYHHHHHYQE